MRTIYKYPIKIVDQQTITSPQAYRTIITPPKIRHVGLDPQGQPCVWVEVDTDLAPHTWELFVVGTGNEIPDQAGLVSVGSFVAGPFVWHVYVR
jgi:hypothetical protein